jgi:hypothetical protein
MIKYYTCGPCSGFCEEFDDVIDSLTEKLM